MIVCASPRGGVGKTSLARLILTHCLAKGLSVEAVDADAQNPLLWQMEHPRGVPGGSVPALKMHLQDIHQEKVRHTLGDLGDSSADVVLIDTPGGALSLLSEPFGSVEQYCSAIQAKRRLVIAWVLDQRLNCARSVEGLLNDWGPHAQLVFVKSPAGSTSATAAEKFSFFDGERADRANHPAKAIKQAGFSIMALPWLEGDTYALLDADSMPLSLAATEKTRPAGYAPLEPYPKRERERVRNYLKAFASCFPAFLDTPTQRNTL